MATPPRPRLAFRVGVVGHRPDRLGHADLTALASVMREILDAIRRTVDEFHSTHRWMFAEAPAIMRAIAPLAEGSDRIFAEQAIDLGFQLCCPFPFAQEEFEQDFSEGSALEAGSLDRFRAILERARRETALTTFELDGSRDDVGTAYGAGGRVVMNQSDMLVVVWDGQRLGRRGGTEDTFRAAREHGVPVVWIDAGAPHRWRLVGDIEPVDGTGWDQLANVVVKALDLPAPPGHRIDASHHAHKDGGTENEWALAGFYAERKPKFNGLGAIWRIFRDRCGSSSSTADDPWTFPGLEVPSFEKAVERDWPKRDDSVTARVVDRLRRVYAWPDQMAVLCADRYRAASVVMFGLAALAVGAALAPIAIGAFAPVSRLDPRDLEWSFIFVELLLIATMLALLGSGRRGRWHERWIDYRLVAELVRHLRLVTPLGGSRPFPQVPAHLARYGQPNATWAFWYVRAIERELGLLTTRIDDDHLLETVAHLAMMLDTQVGYHRMNAGVSHRIHHRLHNLGKTMLVLTLIACTVHLLPERWFTGFQPAFRLAPLLIGLSAFLPALGAALAGIDNQGEFLRISKRSEAMASQLRRVLAETDVLGKGGHDAGVQALRLTHANVLELTTRAAMLMVTEVLDWRVVVLDRPLNPPA